MRVSLLKYIFGSDYVIKMVTKDHKHYTILGFRSYTAEDAAMEAIETMDASTNPCKQVESITKI